MLSIDRLGHLFKKDRSGEKYLAKVPQHPNKNPKSATAL